MTARKKKDMITIIETVGQSAASSDDVAHVPGRREDMHARLFSIGRRSTEIEFDEFVEKWRKTRDQVAVLMQDFSKKTFGSLELNELEVSLTLTGEGTIGIASTSAEASVVLKFTKKGKT